MPETCEKTTKTLRQHTKVCGQHDGKNGIARGMDMS